MSLLNVGARALLANQSALQTVGHNISNVKTPGYSRQTVVLQNVKGQFMGGGYIGNGVELLSVQRNHSELLTRQSTAADAVKAADTVRAERMRQVQDIFSGGPEGLGAGINDMMNALADVVSAPTDLTARTVFLTRADETALRLNSAAERLDGIQYGLNEEMANGVQQINTIAPQIAALNEQIMNAKGSGQPPNDLLDQRDQLIRDLNQYIQTSQVNATDGSISLFVASSQPLVMGNIASTLKVQDKQAFGGGTDSKALYLNRPGESAPIELNEGMLGGGKVAGLVRFQNGELTEARNLLGRLTVGVAQTLNEQNQRGLTLDGTLGTALFKLPQVDDPASTAVPPAQVPGTQGFSLNDGIDSVALFKDPSQFKASDYVVTLGDTGRGTITRLSDNQVIATDVDFSDPAQRVRDGLEFVVSGGNAGDQILFKPFASAASAIQALVLAPNDLAAANPVNAAMGTANKGALQLVGLQTTGQHWDLAANPPAIVNTGGVVDTTLDPPSIPPQVTLKYQDATDDTPAGFIVLGTAETPLNIPLDDETPPSYDPGVTVVPYVSGQPIRLNGWSITLQGTPKHGDTVTIGKATNYGDWYKRDAGNAAAMMALRDATLFDGATLSDGYAGAMAKIGTRTQTATFAANLSTDIATSLNRERSAVSGVNLDEEASKLLQYQQAYQASAKAIQVAQSVFSDLIQAVGR